MSAEWLDVLDGSVLTRIAMVEGYSLTVIGGDGLWVWFVDLDGHGGSEGIAYDLATAMAAAEDLARQLALGAKAEDKD